MKASKLLAGLSLYFVCGVGLIALQKNSLKQQELTLDKDYYLQEELKLASMAKLQKNLPSFGFDNLLANFAYLDYVQYFGDAAARDATGYSVVTDYFENIVDRDPNFLQSYYVMSASNSIFAAQPGKTVELIDKVLSKVDRNVPHHPFLLWNYKATDEILFLGDLEAAKKSYETAAEWAREWATATGDDIGYEMADRFEKTAAYLATNPDPKQAQVGAWMNILSTTRDPKTANHVVGKLQELGVKISISENGRVIVEQPQISKS